MFPDNADWLHGPDSNHDLDLLHRRGKLGVSLQLWRESMFPLELTSAVAGTSAQKSSAALHTETFVSGFWGGE